MMLKIKDVKSLNMLVEALAINGYKIKTETVYREWPYSGIDYFALKVEEGADNE